MKNLKTFLFAVSILSIIATPMVRTMPNSVMPFETGDKIRISSSDGKILEIDSTLGTDGNYGLSFKTPDANNPNNPRQIFEVRVQYTNNMAIVGFVGSDYSANYALKGQSFDQDTVNNDMFGNWSIYKLIPKQDSTGEYAIYNSQGNRYKNKTAENGIEDITLSTNESISDLPDTAFFKIEKASVDINIPTSLPFYDGDFVTIRDSLGQYLQCSYTPPDPDSGRGAHAAAQLVYRAPILTNQIFKVRIENDGKVSFVGTIVKQRYQTDTNGNIIITVSPDNYKGQKAAILTGPGGTSGFSIGNTTIEDINRFQIFASTKPNFFALKNVSNGKYKISKGGWPFADSYMPYNKLINGHLFEIKKVNANQQTSSNAQTGSNSSETIAKLNATISQMQTTINLNDQTIKRLRQEIEKLNAQLSSRYKGKDTSSYSRQTGYRASGNIRGSQTTRLNTGYRRSNTTRGRAPAASGRASAGRGYSRTRNIR